MKARAFHPVTALLSLYCAVWIAFVPLIPRLHQVFSNHSHVFCTKHFRMEDAGPRQSGHAVSTLASGAGVQVEPTKGDGAGAGADIDERPACACSNLVAQVTQSSPPPQAAPVPAEEPELKLVADVVIPALAIYRLAPKHSPPLAA
ncbi:MAG: hypothetical protein V2A73_21490 [Pseudomonadota bacterium]